MTLETLTEPIVEANGYQAHDLILTEEKFKWMWNQILNHRALYAQMGYITPEAFVNLMTKRDQMFYEITREDGTSVGSVYMAGLGDIDDIDVHVFFYDRTLSDKAPVCRALCKYVFQNFKYHRLNAAVPQIYGPTARYIQKIGFKLEGTRREHSYIQGRWVDLLEFGLLESYLE